MQIRHLVVATLMAAASAAHADVIPSTPGTTQGGFLTSWTAGNGADVLASGVLAANSKLIGGMAYGSGSGLTEALFSKASAALGEGSGQVHIERGVEGQYVIGAGNGIAAAMFGDNVSVMNTADGRVALKNTTAAASAPGAPRAPSAPSALGAPSAPSASTGNSGTGPTGSSGNGYTGDSSGSAGSPGTNQETSGQGNLLIPALVEPSATAVPEPSTIALMLVGLMGAGAMARRRS